ncbi:MAG: DUF2630 family protein [Solirubrobacteraceae bacterium]
MSFDARGRVGRDDVEDLSQIPSGVEAFAHIEGLAGEEQALLAVPHEQRKQEQHERLRVLSAELDHIWETLRQRAERHGGAHGSEKPPSDSGKPSS